MTPVRGWEICQGGSAFSATQREGSREKTGKKAKETGLNIAVAHVILDVKRYCLSLGIYRKIFVWIANRCSRRKVHADTFFQKIATTRIASAAVRRATQLGGRRRRTRESCVSGNRGSVVGVERHLRLCRLNETRNRSYDRRKST